MESDNRYEIFWFLFAVTVLIVYAYSMMTLSNVPRNSCTDYGINCPDEQEMRNGDTW